MDGDVHLGRPALIRARAQSITDHLLEPANRSLGSGTGGVPGGPPGVMRGSARQPSIASSVNHTVKLPRWRKLASYSRQFVTLVLLFGDMVAVILVQLERQDGCPGSGQGEPPTPGRFRAPLDGSVQQGHQGYIVNYGERFRAGERISTGFVESAVNQIVDKRFDKRQSMRWTQRGAHMLLQTRTRVLNGDLDRLVRDRYPTFKPSAVSADVAPGF